MRRLSPALFLLILGCRPPQVTAEMTLLVGRPADAITLDPARAYDTDSAEVCEQIYDKLVRYKRRTLEIEPALAERWTVSPNGTEWTFSLRRGVTFHDGSRFDADAVLFNLERQRDGAHPYHEADFASWEAAFRNVARLEKIDDFTVRLVIERPYAPFLANLAVYGMGMVSPAAVRRWGHGYAQHPVGTGPFRLVEWSHGDRITLERNPDYWDGPPAIGHLVFLPIHGARQRLVAIEGGAIDVAERLAPEDLQFVALHPELKIERVAGNNVSYLAMNTGHAPLDDPRIREAISHAINKMPIVKMVYQGLALSATGALAPSSWAHIDLEERAYDPMLARRLLREARFVPPKAPLKLLVMSTPRDYLPSPEKVARIIAHNLAEVGVPVEIIAHPLAEHLRRTSAGEHDLCLLGWSGDNGDPDNFLYTLFDGDNATPGNARNVAFLRDPKLHGLLRWAQETEQQDQRMRYYAEAQRSIAAQTPWVPLAHAQVVLTHRTHVSDIEVTPSSTSYFHHAVLEPR